jgi:hypothetical protein
MQWNRGWRRLWVVTHDMTASQSVEILSWVSLGFKLINMNHNRYPSSCKKALTKNAEEQSYEWKLYSSNEVRQHYTRDIFSNITTICPISFNPKVWAYILYILELKESHFHSIVLVVKTFTWRSLITSKFYVKGQTKWPVIKKNIELWDGWTCSRMQPQLIIVVPGPIWH